MNFERKSHYDIDDLLRIMSLLRGAGGCPWDREQDHRTLRKNLIEEAYEVAEAIDNKDPLLLREELGDLLLQIVFHAQIEAEAGVFTFSDVCNEICQKLIQRHPHVFGDLVVDKADQVLRNWEEIKHKQKGNTSGTTRIKAVPQTLPALMRASKIQSRAAQVGFDFADVSGAITALESETEELKAAIQSGDANALGEELGDLLFSVVNVARFIQVEPEESLTRASEKFVARFEQVETLAEVEGIDLKTASIESLDTLWNQAKAKLYYKD